MQFGKEAVDGDFEKPADFQAVVRHIVVIGEVVIYPSRSPCQFLQDLLHKGKSFCWSPHAFKSCALNISYNQVVYFNKLLKNSMVL